MSVERDDFSDDDDVASLQPTLKALWSYRRTIGIALGVTVVGCVLAWVFAYAWTPKERVASLGFQLIFEGADRGEYPNGTKFSSAEIVSTPVLTEVFKANELQRYSTFSKFKDSMFVLQTNRDLELLYLEYTAKLSDSKLGPVDRARLEEEFRRKRESLSAAGFSLNIRRSEGLIGIPNASLSKILQDTLSTWASQTAEKKGATRFNIPVLSKNALQRDFLTSEDYIISADILRTKIERILKTVFVLAEIPGADAVRMDGQVGLADLRANLEDLNRFKIEPLISLIRESGLTRNPTRISQYFEGRLVEVQLARTEMEHRIKSMQDALLGYEQRGTVVSGPTTPGPTSTTVTPQLSESFLDRLVQMSTQSIDVGYRQGLTKRIIDNGIFLAELKRQAEYYELMRRAFMSVQGRADGSVASDVTRRMGQAYDEVARSIDQVQAFYALISQHNLNPDTVVYTVTTPFAVRTTSALSSSTMVLYTFVVLLGALIMTSLACLAHDYFRHWISPPHASHATRDDATRATGAPRATGL
jgi:hypothetical protein